MKIRFLLMGSISVILASCASPEERAKDQIDTSANHSMNDSAETDTVTVTGSTSGSNGTGTDTTDIKRQKATRQAGQ